MTKTPILGCLTNGQTVSLPTNRCLINRNMLIVGGRESGKTKIIADSIVLQAIKNGSSVIATSRSNKLYERFADTCRKNGYEVRVLDLSAPEKSDCWNPILSIDGDRRVAAEMSSIILHNVPMNDSDDRVSESEESSLLRALLCYVDGLNEPGKNNLGAAYDILCIKDKNKLDELFYSLPKDHPAHIAYSDFDSRRSEMSKSLDVSMLKARLNALEDESFRMITNGTGNNTLELEAPAIKKCAYFIILNDKDPAKNYLAPLFVSFACIRICHHAANCKDENGSLPVELILDDLPEIGYIGSMFDGSDLARILSVSCSFNLNITMGVRSIVSLERCYPAPLCDEIAGNCDVQLFAGEFDKETAEYIAKKSGEVRIDPKEISGKDFLKIPVHPKPRYSPEEIVSLPTNMLFAYVRACGVIPLQKYDSEKHPVLLNQ